MPSKNFTTEKYKSASVYKKGHNKRKGGKAQANTCESSMEPVGATKKAPSSIGGDGSPSSSSSSTTDGLTESGVPSSEATNI